MTDDALVVFTPSGKRGRFARGTLVLLAARQLGVDIDSVCGGRGICGRCQVGVSEGEFAKFGLVSRSDHLSPPGEMEERFVKQGGILIAGQRLSCASEIRGDLVLDVPAASQIHRQIVRKRVESRTIDIVPLVKLHYVELEPPTIDDQTSDYSRLQAALEAEWGVSAGAPGLAFLQALPRALREGGWRVTVALRETSLPIAVCPGFRDQAHGLAVDVGTTTIAAHLCDLHSGDVLAAAGAMNPQIRFGEDLISRISYLQLNPNEADTLSTTVRRAIAELAAETCAEAGIRPGDILEASFVGNPIMHHILLGLDPLQLGRAPFPLVVDEAVTVAADDLDLGFHAGAQAYLLPCIAGHVGADTAGVLLSESPHRSDELVLIADVGTNAEIVLGNRPRLLACSSPTGPAFEGAQIDAGQRAAPGAIERVRIERETLAPRFRVIGSELWSDEPGFHEAIKSFGVTGICGSGIIEAVAEMHLAGILASSGLIDGRAWEQNPHVVPDGRVFSYRLFAGPPLIDISQTDVRAIQLAKAALYAGARLLMDRLGVETLDRIVLAGAFGSYIDPLHAMALGMIPDCPLDRVSSAGNAAGTGARIALLNADMRGEIEDLVGRVEKIETAAAPEFQDYFVAAMPLPHKDHAFPNLQRALDDGRA